MDKTKKRYKCSALNRRRLDHLPFVRCLSISVEPFSLEKKAANRVYCYSENVVFPHWVKAAVGPPLSVRVRADSGSVRLRATSYRHLPRFCIYHYLIRSHAHGHALAHTLAHSPIFFIFFPPHLSRVPIGSVDTIQIVCKLM